MSNLQKISVTAFVIAATWLVGSSLQAADAVCCRCGCSGDVQGVCRAIPTSKYIEITCWDSVAEEKCLPPPSKCKDGCLPASSAGSKIKVANKLVRKTYFKPIPTVAWVVENLCERCRCENPGSTTTSGASNPSTPVAETPVVYERPVGWDAIPPIPPALSWEKVPAENPTAPISSQDAPINLELRPANGRTDDMNPRLKNDSVSQTPPKAPQGVTLEMRGSR